MAAAKKEVEERKDHLPAVAGFEDDSGAGFENADKDSFALPFLALLQKMSPQVDEALPEYIDGAKAGMWCNTVTSEIYDGKEGIRVVPCAYQRVFLEWVPRDQGGGFVAEYPVDKGLELLAGCTQDDKKRDILPNGNELQDTRVHYVLIVGEDGSYAPGILSLSRTNTKGSRKWMSIMDGIKLPRSNGAGVFTPPMFSHIYRLTTVMRSNDQGSWYVMHPNKERILDMSNPSDEALYADARKFREMVTSGEAQADFAKAEEAKTGNTNEDDIPF